MHRDRNCSSSPLHQPNQSFSCQPSSILCPYKSSYINTSTNHLFLVTLYSNEAYLTVDYFTISRGFVIALLRNQAWPCASFLLPFKDHVSHTQYHQPQQYLIHHNSVSHQHVSTCLLFTSNAVAACKDVFLFMPFVALVMNDSSALWLDTHGGFTAIRVISVLECDAAQVAMWASS